MRYNTRTLNGQTKEEQIQALVQESQQAYDRGEDPCNDYFKNGRSYVGVIKKNEIIKDFIKLGADDSTVAYLTDSVDFDEEYAKDKRSFMSEWTKRINYWNENGV